MGLSNVAVSVNVSRADIYDPNLSSILLQLLDKYQVPIKYLHLEITESAYTDNPDQIIVEVGKLRELGFIVEMDDFGSGYSSLNMLAKMPVDILKLDMRFVQAEMFEKKDKGILSFVISLAKWLDLAVVAEGVENDKQMATLRSMDCKYVQGYYYAKPMPKEEFEALLTTTGTTEMICSSQISRQPIEKNSTLESGPHGRKMLIVDDMEINRAVLAQNFEPDFEVIEKENGSEAWKYLDKHFDQVDIIMLDLLMPVMDGFQLLDEIRNDSRMTELPVIITSQGDAASESRALQMHADDFISKPYNQDVIRHRVYNVLANYQLRKLQRAIFIGKVSNNGLSTMERALAEVEALRRHFDIVRIVEPGQTLVSDDGIQLNNCFAIWDKANRCQNCIAQKAMRDKGRHKKLERSEKGLYLVIAEYIPFGETGAVIEMVTKFDDEIVSVQNKNK